MYHNLSSQKRNQYYIAANESDLDTIHKVWPQTQTTYIWGPSTSLLDAEPALLNPYNPAAIGNFFFYNPKNCSSIVNNFQSSYNLARWDSRLWKVCNPVVIWLSFIWIEDITSINPNVNRYYWQTWHKGGRSRVIKPFMPKLCNLTIPFLNSQIWICQE